MITPKEYLNTYSSKLPLLGKFKKKNFISASLWYKYEVTHM